MKRFAESPNETANRLQSERDGDRLQTEYARLQKIFA